jgi:hypothetical protein
MRMPVLPAYAEEPVPSMRELLRTLTLVLRRRFYARVSEGVVDVLADDYRIQPHGAYDQMAVLSARLV